MNNEVFAFNNSKISYSNGYVYVTNLTVTASPEMAICGTCALILESASTFKLMCQLSRPPTQLKCRCCLLANNNIDSTVSLLSMQKEWFFHENKWISFFEGYNDVNSITAVTDCKICEKCAWRLQSAYIFQKMCGKAKEVLQSKYSSQAESATIQTDGEQNHLVARENLTRVSLKNQENLFDDSQTTDNTATVDSILYKCEQCPKEFKSKCQMNLHRKVVHPITCKLSMKSFKRKCAIAVHHKNVHLKPLYKCGTCSKTYKNRTGVLVHYSSVHLKQYYACGYCEKIYKYRSSCHNHRQIAHLDNRQCPDCAKEYESFYDLQIHRKTCYAKPKYINVVE
jgi:hypothetical protein